MHIENCQEINKDVYGKNKMYQPLMTLDLDCGKKKPPVELGLYILIDIMPLLFTI